MPTTKQIDGEAQWIDVETAARILDMPTRTVRYHCQMDRLPSRKFGRAWRIRKDAVTPKDE